MGGDQSTITGERSSDTAHPSRQKIRTWINRQRTLPNPSWQYIEWLRKTGRVQCQIEIIKKPK